MTKKKGKGWSRARQYSSKEKAQEFANRMRPKFNHVIVEKGSIGEAWGKKRTCYRVWVK